MGLNMENMEQVVNTLYSMENQYNLYGSDLLVRTALVNDHSLDFRHNNTAEWNQIGTHQIQPSNAYIYQDWQGFYRMIGAANTVLEEADKFASKYTLNATQKARIDQMLGEAYFWRAWAHINLCCFFGEGYPCNGDGSKKGIPILTTVTSSYADARKPRNTVDEVYAQVIKDYKEAMDGNISKEGITKDLESMKQAGIGYAIVLEVNIGIPRGNIDFMENKRKRLCLSRKMEPK